MDDIVWRNKYMRKETKSNIYKIIVRPIMTYALDNELKHKKNRQMLRANDFKVL